MWILLLLFDVAVTLRVRLAWDGSNGSKIVTPWVRSNVVNVILTLVVVWYFWPNTPKGCFGSCKLKELAETH